MIKKAPKGFTPEERRLRIRIAERGLRSKDIAAQTGLIQQDVSAVIRGTSRSPRYIAEVYNFLGLEQPAPSEEQPTLSKEQTDKLGSRQAD